MQKVRARNQELEGQLKKDSRTSSKPPSSDTHKKAKRTKSQRQRSGLKPGGQLGHKYHGLEPVLKPEHIEYHEPYCCNDCGAHLKAQPVISGDRRQVFDLPELKREVTEHCSIGKDCPDCGKRNWGRYPETVNSSVQYGPRIQSLSVYLSDYQLIPYARQQQLFSDVFSHPVSIGLLQKSRQRYGTLLQPIAQAIKQALSSQPVIHADESGLRIEGQGQWLHVLSNAHLTYYQVHQKRGCQAHEAIDLLPHYEGTVVHDAYSSYFTYDCAHALCNAHHLRELTFIHEHHQQPWAQQMIGCLLDAKQQVENSLQAKQEALTLCQIDAIELKYQSILNQALEQIPPPPPSLGKRGKKTASG